MYVCIARPGKEIKIIIEELDLENIERGVNTRQVPRFALVEIDLGDDLQLDLASVDLPLEIVGDELLVGGVETEARRQCNRGHLFSWMLSANPSAISLR